MQNRDKVKEGKKFCWLGSKLIHCSGKSQNSPDVKFYKMTQVTKDGFGW